MVALAGSPALAVVGTGAWGVTLAIHTAGLGAPVALLARTEEEAATLRAAGESPRVSGARFPAALRVTADLAALTHAPVVLLVPPAQTMRRNVRQVRDALAPEAVLVSASKGLEIDTALRMTQVIAQEVPGSAARVAALSGPNLSREIAGRKLASTVVACADETLAR